MENDRSSNCYGIVYLLKLLLWFNSEEQSALYFMTDLMKPNLGLRTNWHEFFSDLSNSTRPHLSYDLCRSKREYCHHVSQHLVTTSTGVQLYLNS